jgi:hypothetical protein
MYVNGIYNLNTHTCYSAGVECQGLVKRAASHAGGGYDVRFYIPEDKRMLFTAYVSESIPGMANMLDMTWEITTKTDVTNASYIIPGDVIAVNHSENGFHMGIIASVQYTGSRQVTGANVRIIEASGLDMKVKQTNTWTYFNTTLGDLVCTIRRLKHN